MSESSVPSVPPPGSAGADSAATGANFTKAVDLARRRGAPAQLRILHRGEVAVDERFGVGEFAAFWPFSVSKIFVATLIWALHEDGVLDVDKPVADYWPEFAVEGKHETTIRQVLQHRSGLPRVGGTLAEVLVMTDWERAIERIGDAKPRPNSAEQPAYEWLAWGFILAEVARRAADVPFPDLLRARILDPLHAWNTFAGLPRAESWRSVRFKGRDPGSSVVAAVVNRPQVREAIIPAGGISTNAKDLAGVLEVLRTGDPRLGLSRESFNEMITPSNAGEFDRYSGSKVWWSNGLQLGAPGPSPLKSSAFGQASSPRAFGHNGSNVSIAWSDPDRELTFVYLSGVIEPYPINRLRIMAIEDAALAAVDQVAEHER